MKQTWPHRTNEARSLVLVFIINLIPFPVAIEVTNQTEYNACIVPGK